jgi:hypothetical protein
MPTWAEFHQRIAGSALIVISAIILLAYARSIKELRV